MAGNEPVMAFTAEIRKPREDLCEIWMKNAGDFRPSKPLRVVANPKGKPLRAYDCVGGYSGALDAGAAQPGLVLTGPAPRRDQDVMAAWCLMEPGCELTVGNVEVIQ
jgi:hypothetical protein